MDVIDWAENLKRRFKKEASHEAIDYIVGNVVDGVETTVSPVPGIRFIETDSGLLIAWKHGTTITHLLAPDKTAVLVRGEEKWPSGQTRKNDALLAVADAELEGRDKDAERILRNFMDRGPIAMQRREDALVVHEKRKIRVRKR